MIRLQRRIRLQRGIHRSHDRADHARKQLDPSQWKLLWGIASVIWVWAVFLVSCRYFTRSTDATRAGLASRNKKLLGAPGLTTRNKKLPGAPGLTTGKKATRVSWPLALLATRGSGHEPKRCLKPEVTPRTESVARQRAGQASLMCFSITVQKQSAQFQASGLSQDRASKSGQDLVQSGAVTNM